MFNKISFEVGDMLKSAKLLRKCTNKRENCKILRKTTDFVENGPSWYTRGSSRPRNRSDRNYESLGLVDFLLVLIELFRWGATSEQAYWLESGVDDGGGQLRPNFHAVRDVLREPFVHVGHMDRPVNVL